MNVCLLAVIIAVAYFPYVKTQDEGVSLIYLDGIKLGKVNLETGEVIKIANKRRERVTFDYHYEKGLVFWADEFYKKIFSFDLGSNGPIKAIVDVCAHPRAVAVDWIHDNLYWTDIGKDVIGVARLDGSLVKTMFDEKLNAPKDIVIDPMEGLIFWTDDSVFPKLERAGMDGSHRTVISHDPRRKSAISIDTVLQAIYWSNYHSHYVFACSYNGTDGRIIVNVWKYGYLYILGLDILRDWLYFIQSTTDGNNLYKIDKHGSNNSRPYSIHGQDWSSVLRMKVYHSSKQIPGVNRCVNNGGCTHLCLPAPLRLIKEGDLEHTCACPDDVLPSDNCSTIPDNRVRKSALSIYDTTPDYFSEEMYRMKLNDSVTAPSENSKTKQSKPENSFPTGTIMGITSGIVILALISFYLYKRISMKSE